MKIEILQSDWFKTFRRVFKIFVLDLSNYMYVLKIFAYWEWGVVGEGRTIFSFLIFQDRISL